MTDKSKPTLHPVGAVGLVLLVGGLAAWLWVGEWRWTLTGLLAFLSAAIVGAALDARRRQP
ncbi:hypothetical protein GCM10012275_53010 [Longimycelium tulufanense]|uniref:Uncharacterized protein n=1 Tax=Longimycelium tulufanense TaxID=907463 RepID=A0A8J3CJF5_9PSEU|nr:hypothetical protein [Longimycelium tulufanense]GGM75710.1 hypothetical protein GCM10012275_53010 [Longimycelium tulufanense]